MLNLIVGLIILLNLSIKEENNYIYVDDEIKIIEEVPSIKEEKVISSFEGYITAYGPDCTGCSGITSSGKDVRNSIYYDDIEYGTIRIVAADKSLSFGSIIRINNIEEEPVIAIVLDRGSAIGFNKNVYFDLLYPSEKETFNFGKKYATFDVLREGFA